MIQIRRITTDDPLYAQECALRESALLGQVGLTMDKFKAEFDGVEERFEHFVATVQQHRGGTPVERVVGCAALLPGDPPQLMQMAVDPQRQGEGIGKKLVVAIEQRVFGELALGTIICHARLPAIPFYERLGWAVVSEEFEEVGIPHRTMSISAEAEH